MKDQQWDAIHEVFNAMEKLCEQLALTAEEDVADQTEVSPVQVDTSILVQVRAEIRKQLDFLRSRLAQQFNERDLYLALFPVVAHFDELVQIHYLKGKYLEWPPLQQELFQVDNAGELFFETLDDILLKPQTNPFIFEIYYLCLSNGFSGKYTENPVRINEYLNKLRGKIPVQNLEYLLSNHEETGKIKPIGSFAWYYVTAVVIVVGAYVFFHVLANY